MEFEKQKLLCIIITIDCMLWIFVGCMPLPVCIYSNEKD